MPSLESSAQQRRDLDIDLVAALYQAVGENDSFDALVTVLADRQIGEKSLRYMDQDPALARQLRTLEGLLESNGPAPSTDPLERAVEEVPTASLVVDYTGRLVLANQAGEAFFGLKPGEKFNLGFIDPAFVAGFERFLESARGRGNRKRLIVRLDPTMLQSRMGDGPFPDVAEALIVTSPHRDHGHVALRTLEIPWSEAVDQQLAESFDLTGAERSIARTFFAVRDLKRVATARGTSVATVRTQLKTMYQKTGTSSQPDLLQLLSLMTARATAQQRSKLAEWSDPLGRQQTVTRSDGRTLAYSWQGARDGQPVLVVHGQSVAHILPEEADRHFREAGLKLYLLSRPGFGHSQFDPAMAAIDEHAYAISEFCRIMQLEGIPAISIGNGLVGLSKAAAEHPRLFSAIINVGYLWHENLPTMAKLPLYHRLMYQMAQHSPKFLTVLIKIAFRNIRKYGVDWYLDRFLADLPDALSFFRSGKHGALIRSAVSHMLAQGPAVFVRELQQPLSPWLSNVAGLDTPMLFLLPEFEMLHDFDSYRQAFPPREAIEFRELKNSGELYFYDSSETIAQAIIGYFDSTLGRSSPMTTGKTR